MIARFHSWLWKKIQQHPVITIITVAGMLVAALILVIILGYWFNWSWVGVNGGYSKITTTSTTHGITTATEQPLTKTLWDWLQLLIIPIVLAIGGYLFNLTITRNEQKIAKDNQREAALREYIDKMSELLLEKKLRQSGPDDEIRKIARVQTLTVVHSLDEIRKGRVLQFLYESGLIDKDQPIIDLHGIQLRDANLLFENLANVDLHGALMYKAGLSMADLSEANLSGAWLVETFSYGANLRGANLSEANLHDADLTGADLSEANLRGADLNHTNLIGAKLEGAFLIGADLSKANLLGARYITEEQLKEAKSLEGATMPDGSKHP